jgi:hypothetical protein
MMELDTLRSRWSGNRPLASRHTDAGTSPSTQRLFLLLVAANWFLLLVQSFLFLPVLETDPLLQDLPTAISLKQTYWSMRLVALLVSPLVLGMRVFTLSLLLHGLLTWWNRKARVGDLRRGILQAESIFLLESACATLLLVIAPPASLLDAQSLRLRAGLDLLWQPASPQWAAWVGSANLFVIWWADCIRRALRRTYGIGRSSSLVVATVLGLVLATIRSLLLLT